MPDIETIKAWYREDRDHSSEWRDDAREDYAFVAGDQWSEEDRMVLEEQLRPCITFNRVGVIVDAVSGSEVTNRREVRYIPREQGDVNVNELLTGASKWFRDECDAEDEESDAFLDLVTCGMGWTETRLDYEDDPDGAPLVDRIDPMEMLWDASSRKRNLGDARRLWRVRKVSLPEAQELVGEQHDASDLNAAWAGEFISDDTEPTDREESRLYLDKDQHDGQEGKVTLVELRWVEREPYYRVADQATGQIAEFSPAEHAKLQERVKVLGMELKSVRQTRKVYKRAFIGADILDQDDLPSQEGFGWECMTGKRDRNKGVFYGLVRVMKDPQRWANKWLSQTLHIMNSNSKGGLLAERDAFDNVTQAEESWADPSGITFTKPDAIQKGKIQVKAAAQFPAGFFQITEFAVDAIRDTTGVNLEMLGMREADQPGVLEYQRRQAGMTVLGTLFDAMRRYHKRQGRYMLDLIVKFLSDGRLVRIAGKDGEQYVPLIRDPNVVKYDVIVDDAPSSPNQKEATWNVLTQLMPALKEAMSPQVLLEFLAYSPLPASLVQKLREQLQQPNPGAQLQQAAEQAKIDKDQAQATLYAAQAQAAGAQIQLDAAQIPLTQAQIQAEMQRSQIEARRAATDAYHADQQGALKTHQMAQQADMALHDHAVSMQQGQEKHVQGLQQGSERHQQGLESMRARQQAKPTSRASA